MICATLKHSYIERSQMPRLFPKRQATALPVLSVRSSVCDVRGRRTVVSYEISSTLSLDAAQAVQTARTASFSPLLPDEKGPWHVPGIQEGLALTTSDHITIVTLALAQRPGSCNSCMIPVYISISFNMVLFFNVFLAECFLQMFLVNAQTIVVTTLTAAPSQPTNEPSFVDDQTFQSTVLNSTNFFRSEHNASSLSWNDSLANFGSDYVGNCDFTHSVCTRLTRRTEAMV